MKLKCSTLVATLLLSLSVFLGELAKTEYKSQMSKRKLKKQLKSSELVVKDSTKPTDENVEYV